MLIFIGHDVLKNNRIVGILMSNMIVCGLSKEKKRLVKIVDIVVDSFIEKPE